MKGNDSAGDRENEPGGDGSHRYGGGLDAVGFQELLLVFHQVAEDEEVQKLSDVGKAAADDGAPRGKRRFRFRAQIFGGAE